MAEEQEKKDSSVDKINNVAQKGRSAYNSYKNVKKAYKAVRVARAGMAAAQGATAAAATSEIWVPIVIIGLVIVVIIVVLFGGISAVKGGDLANNPYPSGGYNSSPDPNVSPGPTLAPGQEPKKIFYCQWRGSWANNSYDDGTISGVGCAPTSMAMILSSFGVKKDPGEVASMFHDNGWDWRPGSGYLGTNPWRVTKTWLNSMGFDRAQSDIVNNDKGSSSINLNSVKSYTDAGWLLYAAVHGKNLPAPVNGGHQIVIEGADPSAGTVTIRDPNNCGNGISKIPVSSVYLWYLVTPIRIKGS